MAQRNQSVNMYDVPYTAWCICAYVCMIVCMYDRMCACLPVSMYVRMHASLPV